MIPCKARRQGIRQLKRRELLAGAARIWERFVEAGSDSLGRARHKELQQVKSRATWIGIWLERSAIASLLFAAAAHAQVAPEQNGQSKPSAVSQMKPASQPVPDEKVPLLDRPITLADFPNMEPRPGLKEKLGHLTQFVQNIPTDGAPASGATDVYIGRTNTTLYIVFLCFDDHPELIRTHLARRENILKELLV